MNIEYLGLCCDVATVNSETLLGNAGLRSSECKVAGLGTQVSHLPGNRLMKPHRWEREFPWVTEVLFSR